MNTNPTFAQFLKQMMSLDPRRVLPMLALALLILIVGTFTWGWWFFFVGLAFYALFYYLSLRNVFKGVFSRAKLYDDKEHTSSSPLRY